MSTQTTIAIALKCAYHPNVVLYWNTQTEQNAGPAYRMSKTEGAESGSLALGGWAHISGRRVEDAEVAGYNIRDYFNGADGAYTGPDQYGIYPVLS